MGVNGDVKDLDQMKKTYQNNQSIKKYRCLYIGWTPVFDSSDRTWVDPIKSNSLGREKGGWHKGASGVQVKVDVPLVSTPNVIFV